jgi:hypothetical protein
MTTRPDTGTTARPGGATTDSLFLNSGRALLAQTLIDTCTIQRQSGGGSENLTTGLFQPGYLTIYSGPCKVQGAAAASSTDVGEAHLAIDSPILHVPIAVTGVQEADVVTITASANDPELVGKVFRIQGPHHKSNATARRFQCTEVSS